MSKVTFLGQEYHHEYFNGSYFVRDNSSLSFVIDYYLEVDFLNKTIMRIILEESNIPLDFNTIIQKTLDDNEEEIVKQMSKTLNDMAKQMDLANHEFGKVLILV